jgi:prephenate dehydratase
MTRIAYLGPAGTFTEEAALRYQAGAQLIPCSSEAAVASAVESGMADEGVLPIENSLEGAVTRTVDVLVHDSQLSIRAEVILAVELCLIARKGTATEQIAAIYSKPEALNQCRKFIERCFPKARQEAALSTTAAVETALGEEGSAAIASARAAQLYGAEVLARGVQDAQHNKTRFVVLGATDAEPTGRDKTSVAFTVAHDRPGTLVEVLHEFADRSINLTKIESRPSREELGIYVFLVDLDGHRLDPPVAAALAAVEAKAFFFRLLGSYPRYDDARDP